MPYFFSFPFLHTVSCSHGLGTMDMGPTSHLVFSAHKLPAHHYTTQAFGCIHPYLLYCAHCAHIIWVHTYLPCMHSCCRHSTSILCIDLPCTHNVNAYQLYTYMFTIHSLTIYTHFLYVYTRFGHVNIHSTFEFSEDTCKSTVCNVFRLCTCFTQYRDIQCPIPTHLLCVLNLLGRHSHLWYTHTHCTWVLSLHHLLLTSAHSVYICIYC